MSFSIVCILLSFYIFVQRLHSIYNSILCVIDYAYAINSLKFLLLFLCFGKPLFFILTWRSFICFSSLKLNGTPGLTGGFQITKRPQPKDYGLIFCPNVNHLKLLFNLFFLTNVPILIPVTVFNLMQLLILQDFLFFCYYSHSMVAGGLLVMS